MANEAIHAQKKKWRRRRSEWDRGGRKKRMVKTERNTRHEHEKRTLFDGNVMVICLSTATAMSIAVTK